MQHFFTKNNLFILSTLLLTSPLAGQSWLKSAGKNASVQHVPTGNLRGISSALEASTAHPMPVRDLLPTTSISPQELNVRVQRAVAASMRDALVGSEIERVVQQNTSPVVATAGVQPNAPMAPVWRNEFLDTPLNQRQKADPSQVMKTLVTLREDLKLHLVDLRSLESYPNLQALLQDVSKNPTIRRALEATGDVSAIGLYGTATDGELLYQFYEALYKTPLEPLALTAVVRACVTLHAIDTLRAVLIKAPHTTTYDALYHWAQYRLMDLHIPAKTENAATVDLAELGKILPAISRLAGLHLDSSLRSSRAYYSLRASFDVLKEQPTATPLVSASNLDATPTPVPLPDHLGKEEGVILAKNSSLGAPSKQPTNLLPVSEETGVYEPVIPEANELPYVNPITKQYPSGLENADRLVKIWMEYYQNGYFKPRNQIEAIRGMSPAKANNIMEYLYYLSLPEAERVILDPIRQTGRLPDFMYDARLIPGTKRLAAGYYKNKFNENVSRFIELAGEDGSVFTRNAELVDLITSMEDYNFEQGFAFTNDPQMSAALRQNWKVIVNEVLRHGMKADRKLMNRMWVAPIALKDGKVISLRKYFSQKSPSAFFDEGRMPEFYLNSPKWVSWENERRNLAAQEYIDQMTPRQEHRPWWQRGWEKMQDWFVLGKRTSYLTLTQFGRIMVEQYKRSFGEAWSQANMDLLADPTGGPSTCTMTVNNFDQLGGVCQASFSDGGFSGRLPSGYDGTSKISRFKPINFENVPVVGFDLASLEPKVLTLQSVPYLQDLKKPNVNKLRASIMVRDGLDVTRDLLDVGSAEKALFKIPHLKATIYPHSRLAAYKGEVPQFMDGGGLAGYLALFTPDFYPLKKVFRLRFQEGRFKFVPEYFVRKEVVSLAGLVHRDHLTFTYMLFGRITPSSGLGAETGASAPSKP